MKGRFYFALSRSGCALPEETSAVIGPFCAAFYSDRHRKGILKMKKIKALFASLAVTRRELFLLLSGSAILAFGLYQVHSISGVTEGGVLGLTLLGHHWLGISPSVSSLLLNAACYLLGWRLLGRGFVARSIVAGGAFSLFYAVFEQFPILVPELSEHPLIAALVGALFVGVGVGLCVRAGGAPGGDDALSMSLEHVTRIPIQWIYLISDLIVLGLSLTYIPLRRILYSLLTVILSGQLIGIVQRAGKQEKDSVPSCTGNETVL